MLGTFFSYSSIFFLYARLVNLTGKINWMATLKTIPKHEAVPAIIFPLIVLRIKSTTNLFSMRKQIYSI